MKRNFTPYGDFDPDVDVEMYLYPGSTEEVMTGGEDDSPLSHLEADDRALVEAWGDLSAAGIGFIAVFMPFILIGGYLENGCKSALLVLGMLLGIWGARISLLLHQKQRLNETKNRDN